MSSVPCSTSSSPSKPPPSSVRSSPKRRERGEPSLLKQAILERRRTNNGNGANYASVSSPSPFIPFENERHTTLLLKIERLTLNSIAPPCTVKYQRQILGPHSVVHGKAVTETTHEYITYAINMGRMESICIQSKDHTIPEIVLKADDLGKIEFPKSIPLLTRIVLAVLEVRFLPSGDTDYSVPMEKMIHEYRQDGSLLITKEIEGVLEGDAHEFDLTGQLEFKYVQGKRQGPATKRYYNSDCCRFSYAADKIDGEATYEYQNIAKISQSYLQGERQGPAEIMIGGRNTQVLNPMECFQKAAIDLQRVSQSRVPGPEITIQLNIKSLSGETYSLRCNVNMNIKGLKRILSALENTPLENLGLMYHTKNLEDNLSLKGLNLQDKATLLLVPPLKLETNEAHDAAFPSEGSWYDR